ncbi:sugar ABC transporter permease [Capsulimonas corticalis]|uniref:Sugar ABC transporter permease n=1 Tax=Capsulimonas corticalis TaxID=2219043 RepID=A0A402CUK3_9BACT|nr:carbohydrate ABC transporter permease [Capsulimonas corticalis]BDI28994.1 sugar ABC transporter permease [Capsulimonas corticalis]
MNKDFAARRRSSLVWRLALLSVLGLMISMPFVWMVSASFKPRVEVEQPQIVPLHATSHNYPIVLNLQEDPVQKKKLDLHFGRWYFNSVFMAFGTTLLQVLTSALAAYAFARIKWRGRDQVFMLYLATMMIPGVVLMIPNFQAMVSLSFINTYHGLIIPAAFSAFGTFLLRQFMMSVSPALDEAATIDGANHWQIFWDVVMPLARPGLIALTVMTFLGSYQSFFWPLIMLNDAQMFPMSVGMLSLDTSYGQQTELIMAATVMNVAPLIIVFTIFQKYLVSGLQLGGVKG